MSLRLAIIGLLAAASALGAQQPSLRGRTVLADSVTPASGVVLEAVLVDDSRLRARTLSSANGTFMLRLPRAGAWRLSAMRIGYFPTMLGVLTVAAGEQRTAGAPFVVSGVAVAMMLASLEVDTAQLCGRGPEDSRLLVATLLAQARSALAATVLSSPDGAARAEWHRFALFTDRLGTPLTPLRVEPFSGATDRPFRAVSADSLARDGYFWDRSDHVQFNAPDAQVLLSEEFVGSHCYRLSEPHPARAEWIGVSFSPAASRRGIVDVRGTLWLDRASTELRVLEYTYVGLPEVLEAVEPRGRVEFLRLPTDVWVVGHWEMRLPRVGIVDAKTGMTRAARAQQINAVMITGGEVAAVHRGEVELFRSEVRAVDRFPEIATRVGAPPACVDAPATKRDESGIIYGSLVDTLGNPIRGTARLTWVNLGRARGTEFGEERSVSATDGLFIFCGIGIGRLLTLTAFDAQGRSSEPIALRLRATKTWTTLDVTIR